MTGIRVLHVVDSLEPQAGAVAVSLMGLFRYLEQRNIASEWMSADGSGFDSAGDTDQHPIERGDPSDPADVLRRVRDAQIVHLHGWNDRARKAASASQKLGRPYILSPLGDLCADASQRGGWWNRLRRRTRDGRLIRGAALVTALHQREAEELRDAGLHDRIDLLTYGLDMGEYVSPPLAAGRASVESSDRTLLYLGPIRPEEGLVLLLKVVAELGTGADGWSVALAGAEVGDWRNQLEAAIRRKGAVGRVHFVPAPDVTAQCQWLARASVLVSPALHVRCPVSIMQAVAAGVPVVATDRVAPDGLAEYIQMCAPSREGLREALRSTFRLSVGVRQSQARQALEHGRKVFDWPVLVENHVRLYQSLIKA